MWRRFVFFAALMASVLLMVLALTPGVASVQAQGGITPTATVDRIPTLQAQVEALSTRTAGLETQIDLKKQQLDIQFDRLFQNPLVVILAAATIVLSVLGYGNYRDFKHRTDQIVQDAQKEARRKLENALARIDPQYFEIHYPESEKAIGEYLRELDFPRAKPYKTLNISHTSGIVIYVPDRDQPQGSEQATANVSGLKQFLRDHSPSRTSVAYIIYTQWNVTREDMSAMYDDFDNIVTANYPITVLTQINAVARVLLNARNDV